MKRIDQSLAAMFLVAAIGLVVCPSISMAQDDNPFGTNEGKAQVDPFGSDAAANKGKVTSARQATKPSAPRKLAVTAEAGEIRNRLTRRIDFVYDSEPFGDVVAQLSEDLGINIVIDSGLDGVVDEDTEVSANLSGIRVTDGLRAMLKGVDATYTIKDGVLLIISIDDDNEPDYLTRHMIDVKELLRMIKVTESDRIGKPVFVSEKRLSKGKTGDGTFQVAPQVETTVSTPEKATVPKNESEQSQQQELLTGEKILTDAITSVVAADTWESNGAGNGNLTCVGNVLIVISSESVAEEVHKFVSDLQYKMKRLQK